MEVFDEKGGIAGATGVKHPHAIKTALRRSIKRSAMGALHGSENCERMVSMNKKICVMLLVLFTVGTVFAQWWATTSALQLGRYAAVGTPSLTMSIGGLGDVTLSEDYSALANGTYKINGDKMTITFFNANGSASYLSGKTLTYTIIDSTTFAGNGATWERIGY
jgi:hypothetical protein